MTVFGTHFEDYAVGDVIDHYRGKTVTELDNLLVTHLALNTAEPHFNEHRAGRRVVFGGVTLALVVGLAMEDTGENAIEELGMDEVRLLAPVYHGDTIYSISEVVSTQPGDDDEFGIVTFRHVGYNQDDKIVARCLRTARIARRASKIGAGASPEQD